jgi:hypothetical protein
VASILELLCLAFYFVEIYLRLAINPSDRSNRGLDFYTKLRLVVVILLTWDCLTSIIYHRPERMIRALLPIVYITRRKSLRQMSWGLMVVAYKCIPVFFLLITIVLAWSYLGRMIFGNLELDGADQFGSLLTAFLTTLESYSCRGYLVFALEPLFQINAGSSLFFVSLTIFADIFCQALIVATGTRQYQLYSVTIFRKELLNRKKAMLAVFGVLQQYTQELAFEALMESSQPPEPLTPPSSSRPVSARSLFDTTTGSKAPRHIWEDRASSVDSAKSDSTAQHSYATNRESLYNPRVDNSELRISKRAWLDFCSHLLGKKKISSELAELLFDKELEIEESGHYESLRNSWNRDAIPAQKKVRTPNEGLSVVGLFRLAALLDGELSIEGDLDSEDEEGNQGGTQPAVILKRPKTKRSSSESFRMPMSRLDPSLEVSLTSHLTLSTASSSISGQLISEVNDSLLQSKPSSSLRYLRWIYKKFRSFARVVAETDLILDFTLPFTRHRSVTRHGIFDTIVSVSRVLLAVQLLFITMPSSPSYWFDIGWGLHAFFWFEMYIRVASLYSKRRRQNLRLFILNLITTTLYSTIARSHSRRDETSTSMLVYICLQWVRLIQVVLPFRISNVIRGLLSLVIRVVFIVFTVIYFFSTIGYYRFCNAFDGQEAEAVDDFAVKWAPYENQLNFNTMLQTLYTLFEVAVLGNWSSVMRAAMLSGFLSALLYFYAYRLLMTLVVMPILTSFIIQAYNARSIKVMNEENLALEKHLLQQRQQQQEPDPHMSPSTMNAILEEEEEVREDHGDVANEEKERSTEASRGSRLTNGTLTSQKSERKLVVTRGMPLPHLPLLILPLSVPS